MFSNTFLNELEYPFSTIDQPLVKKDSELLSEQPQGFGLAHIIWAMKKIAVVMFLKYMVLVFFSVWNRGFDILNGFQNGTNAPLIKVANIMNFL